jgi:hypothetical protein
LERGKRAKKLNVFEQITGTLSFRLQIGNADQVRPRSDFLPDAPWLPGLRAGPSRSAIAVSRADLPAALNFAQPLIER